MASIVSGWVANYLGAARGLELLVWGARVQLILGLILVALAELNREDLSYAKVGVKLVVALAVVACAEIANAKSRKGESQSGLLNAALALTVLNVCVAVLWVSAGS